MPGGSASGQNNAFGSCQFPQIGGDAAEDNAAVFEVHPSLQTGFEGCGLLGNFLLHIMVEPLPFDLVEGDFDFFEFLLDVFVVECFGVKAVASGDDDFTVGQVDGLGGMLDNGGGIGCNEVFIFADAEN